MSILNGIYEKHISKNTLEIKGALYVGLEFKKWVWPSEFTHLIIWHIFYRSVTKDNPDQAFLQFV